MKTAEKIRIALELKPFDEFEYEQLCHLKERSQYLTKTAAIKERFRQTGRSTKIICNLLASISAGNKVLFVSDTYALTSRVTDKIVSLAVKLGLNAELIMRTLVSRSEQGILKLRGIDKNIEIFYDHEMP
jgi:hypothetical protein